MPSGSSAASQPTSVEAIRPGSQSHGTHISPYAAGSANAASGSASAMARTSRSRTRT